MASLSVATRLIEETIERLREGGVHRCETVVFWLGKQGIVGEVHRPLQRVDSDYFRLEPQAMRQLMQYLRTTRTSILAQVHSHPGKAFHSEADDHWAVVRHEGALSLVLPHFAFSTTVGTFVTEAATYRLSAADAWLRVPTGDSLSIVGLET